MKRTNKRILSMLMVLAMMVCLVACGGNSKAAGTYHLTKLDMNGVSVDLKQLGEQAGVEVKVILVLEKDGSFTLDMSTLGAGESVSGTWKTDGGNLTLSAAGEDVPATLDGKTVTLAKDGLSMTFVKE